LSYRDSSGAEIREFRPPEEVFSETSLGSVSGIPVTSDHPAGGVTPTSWRALSIGHVETPHKDGEWISAPVVVADQSAIDQISQSREAGEAVELSCGYLVDTDPTPGEYEGERYDVVQRNIRYNHLAILPRGKAPRVSGAELRLDSAGNQIGALTPEEIVDMDPEQVKAMLVEALQPVLDRVVALEELATQPKADAPPAEEEAKPTPEEAKPTPEEEANARADALEKALSSLKKQIPALAEAHAVARADALSIGLQVEGKDTLALQKEIAQHTFPSFRSDSEIEIVAHYRAARLTLDHGSNVSTLRSALSAGRADSSEELSPRDQMLAEQAKRGK
jgi:hypothetical protein